MAAGQDEHARRLKAAAAWYAELKAPDLAPETYEAFEAWEADPANARAFAEIERTLVVTDRTRFGREAAESRERRGGLVLRGWPAGLGALAAVLVLGVLVFRFWPAVPEAGPVVYATSVGEIREVVLADGSGVTLNTASRIEVRIDDDQRLVRLGAGEALFDVVKDGRPFMVEAGASRTEALGTLFAVQMRGEDVAVTLAEGRVRVGRADMADDDSRVLAPGEQLVMSRAGAVQVSGVDAERLLSWSDGLVAFDNATLAEAVGEMNRYSDVKLVIADQGLASERVSGTFPAGEQAAFAESLELFLALEARVEDDRIVLRAVE